MTNKSIQETFVQIGKLNSSKDEYHSIDGFYKKGVKLLRQRIFGLLCGTWFGPSRSVRSIDNLANIFYEISACESKEEGKKFAESLSNHSPYRHGKMPIIRYDLHNEFEGIYFNKLTNYEGKMCCEITDIISTGGIGGFSGSNGGPIGKLEKVSYRGKENDK